MAYSMRNTSSTFPSPSSTLLRHSRPVRSSRTKVQSYHEESDSDGDQFSRRESLSLRPRSSHRKPVSYREDSTDGSSYELMAENDDSDAVADVNVRYDTPSGHLRSEKLASSRRVPTTNTRSRSKRSTRPKRSGLGLGRPLYKRRKVESETIDIPSSGVVPPWQRLPYHILFDIFYYASHPLVDEVRLSRNPSVQWLVHMARLCKSFHEPALAVLYYSPPLMPSVGAHGLLNLLSKQQDCLSTNYANKVKELHVDVETLLLYKSGPTLGYFNLTNLAVKTPLVKRMRLYHPADHVIGTASYEISHSRWRYPQELFSSMDSSSIRLRSWEWNSRFMETSVLLPFMLDVHAKFAFRSLQELRIMRIGMEDFDRGEDDEPGEQEELLITALKELPHLSRLEFFECPALNQFVLSNLPSTLTHLTITNCEGIDSDDIGSFLASHGEPLRELCLDHNRYVDLSFMVSLAASCKNLEKLRVDISIHDRSSHHDVEPGFYELLRLSEIPTWPTTLQDIELTNLRNWDDTVAEYFFASLIEAAPELRDLRRLVISAILKIGWRDRATFREKWISRLQTVFLRRSAPPNPNRRSIPHDQSQKPTGSGNEWDLIHHDPPSGDSLTPTKRKSRRISERENEDNHSDNYDDFFVQGMCDIVQIRIDNLRPAGTQFNEQDFLDDELSGDEDWSGDRFH
ncbi:hypothetical protein PHISCL_07730 [Aspergillus sclerotialis]|uniref:Uncharacterized protein n=1 Tax=Aspergillus sclerotialis TaxID=2070753 RepID=A0A3A2ZF21_9EURO|nr:hypothetical protein PHISCL_07730 [Aspergillus sclerotialis]